MNMVWRCLLLFGCVGVAAVPSSACYSGVSNAPCAAANMRTVVVAQDGSGDYSTLQAAVDAAQPGDTIQVKDGAYAEFLILNSSGTSTAPIALINAPGAHPVILPGAAAQHAVTLNAQWIIVDGFEIKQGYGGVIVNQGHNTIRNCHIHNNGDLSDPSVIDGQGILVVSASDVLIENNIIEDNGLLNNSPQLVHAIYLSNFEDVNMAHDTIAANILRGELGAGLAAFANGGTDALSHDHLVENNLFENNNFDINIANLSTSTFRNNTIYHNVYPASPAPASVVFYFSYSPGNVFYSNIIYSQLTRSSFYPIQVNEASDVETFDYNLWDLPSGTHWNTEFTIRTDFNTQYKALTGADAHGPSLPTDPEFTSAAGLYLYPQSGSPARNAGDDAQCPALDFDGNPRPAEGRCDIGAYEYGSGPRTPPGGLATSDLSQARAYPNPWRSDRDGTPLVTFSHLTAGTTVRIFTVAGAEVATLYSTSGSAAWNMTNKDGARVASGIYLFVATNTSGQRARGKFAIIK